MSLVVIAATEEPTVLLIELHPVELEQPAVLR